jgi:hypothetical protein
LGDDELRFTRAKTCRARHVACHAMKPALCRHRQLENDMQMTQVQDSLKRIEQCTDQAESAMHNATSPPPEELRRCIDTMHAQAREVRDMAQQSTDQNQLTSRIDQLEATGDQAKRACQKAGSSVDPQLQSAVMQAHDQISNLKKQMH